jgi:acetyl-CoA carboxylase beta subunit
MSAPLESELEYAGEQWVTLDTAKQRIDALKAQVKDQADRLQLAKAEANLDDAVIKELEAQTRQLRPGAGEVPDGPA